MFDLEISFPVYLIFRAYSKQVLISPDEATTQYDFAILKSISNNLNDLITVASHLFCVVKCYR